MAGSDGGLRQLLRKHLPKVHWTTIESRMTESGIPDIEGCVDGITFWIECKATRGWAVKMRPAQIAWLSRRLRAGGRCYVAVRRRARGEDQLWLVAAGAARQLRAGGLGGLPAGAVLGCWRGGPGGWAWGQCLARLAGQGKAWPNGGG